MADVQYYKIDESAETVAEVRELIASLKAMRTELLTTALRSVRNGDIAEYDINTGQQTNRIKYTSTKSVLDSIEGCTRLIKLYSNSLIPRRIVMRDGKNFRRQ